MKTNTERRAELIFYETLERLRDERQGYLDEACGADTALRAEVDELLALHDDAAGFLPTEAPAVPEHLSDIPRHGPEAAGTRIGHYKLLEQIGEGGFGTVWVAEQEQPVRRRVALKIIKPGMDTKEVIARFEQERQALAMMDHPNIARVFDAGATPLGRSYFVMELVRGVKITKYCDQANLTTAERLRLFITVCHAVQHAHQKGIIHRDLKPSNILVTLHDGVPVPKVIDFGVAKATQQQRLTNLTIYTQFEKMIGTPLYMSPEQAEMSGLDIDTRSDVYSLGVLLYELLTGTTPFDPQKLINAGLDEMRRVIRETEPPKPSTRLTQLLTVSAVGRSVPHSALRTPHSAIDSDLDWIVMKALEKDRARRYETADNFARDIQRHLASEPVHARPPSAGYRFRRTVKRNKAAFSAAAAVVAALLTGLGIATWMYLKEKDARERAVAAETGQSRLRQLAVAAQQAESRERTKAETEASKSRHVARFLQAMLVGVGPSVAQGSDTKLLREILDKTAASLSKDLDGQPEVEAELRMIIGHVYDALGDYGKAEEMLAAALTRTKELRGDEHAEVAILLNLLATGIGNQGRLEDAETMHREALAMQRKLPGGAQADVSVTLNNLGTLVAELGRLDEAGKIHREALAMNRKIKGDEHEDVATSLNNVAVVLEQMGKDNEAETMHREALAMQRKLLGSDHPEVAISLNNLANVVQKQNKLKDSEELFHEVLPLQRKLLGDDHPNVAAALNGLGLSLHKQGKDEEAEPLLREGVEIEKKARKTAHPQTATLVGNWGRVLAGRQRYPEAEARFREALDILGQLPGGPHPDAVNWRNRLSLVLEQQKKWADLETMVREDLETARKTVPPGGASPKLAGTLKDLAATLSHQGKAPEAEPFIRESVEMYRKLLPGTDPKLASPLGAMGIIVQALGKYPEAESLFKEARGIISPKSRAGGSGFVPNWHPNLAAALEDQTKFPEAETMRREAVDTARNVAKPNPARLESALSALAENLYRQKKFADAEPLFREVIASIESRLGNDSEQLPGPKSRLGRLLADWAWMEGEGKSEVRNPKSEIVARARESEQLLRDCLDAWRRGGVPNALPWTADEYRSRLGGALVAVAATDPALTGDHRVSRFAEAESLLLESNDALQREKSVEAMLKHDSLTRIIRLYEAWEKPDEATEWRRKVAGFERAEVENENEPVPPEP